MPGKAYIGTSGVELQNLALLAYLWSARTCPRFKSGDMSPHSISRRGEQTHQAARFWQCAQNHEVRPPIVADFNARPQRGHLPRFPRCVNSHDFGKRLKSVFNAIAFSST
jgi:hypothetical protein